MKTRIFSFPRLNRMALAASLFAVNTALAVSTTTSVSISPGTSTQGQPVIVHANVSPTAAPGTVQFYVDNNPFNGPVTLAGGHAQISVVMSVGPHTARAVYGGGTYIPPGGQGPPVSYSGSASSTVGFTVKYSTTTFINLSPPSTCSGLPFSAVATVSPSSAPGTIQFKQNGANVGAPVTLVNGQAGMGFVVNTTTGTSQSFQAIYSGGPVHMNSSSAPATETINAPITISSQPADVSACAGTPAVFSVTTSGTVSSRQWQESSDGTSWASVTSGTGGTTATYTRTVGNHDNGKRFLCAINGPCSGTIYSTAATLTSLSPEILNLITDPEAIAVDITGAAYTDANGHYTRSTPTRFDNSQGISVEFMGGNWTIHTAFDGVHPGYLYQGEAGILCSIYHQFGTLINDHSSPVISPTLNVCEGNTATLTLNPASGSIQGWQVSTDNGANWTDLGGGTTFFAGPFSLSDNGNLFRCVLNNFNACGPVVSQNIKVLVNLGAEITSQPFTQWVCPGAPVTFSVSANNAVSYQWRRNGVPLANGGRISGVNTPDLTINPVQVSDFANPGQGYDCVVVRNCDQISVRAGLGQPPNAEIQAVFTAINTAVNLTLHGNHPCNPTLTYEIVSYPEHGDIDLTTAAGRTYTPDPGFIGTDTFTFRTRLGELFSSPATVTVFVVPPPVVTTACRKDRVVVQWEMASGFGLISQDFVIKRATTINGTYTTIGTTANNLARMFSDTTVTPGVTYYYKVLCRLADPNSFPPVLFETPLSAPVSGTTCSLPIWGPTDVAFVFDNTSSMGDALAQMQADVTAVIDEILTSSGTPADVRFGLVTPDNDVVNVRFAMSTNRPAFVSALNAVTAGGGGLWQESTDECLNTVVNALPAAGRTSPLGCNDGPIKTWQTGNFSPSIRTNVRKLVVIVTDALPGGFCQDLSRNFLIAHGYALDAAAQGMQINAIQVPFFHEGDPADGFTDPATVALKDYEQTTCGWYSMISPNGVGMKEAILKMLYTAGGTGSCPPVTRLDDQVVCIGSAVTFTTSITGTDYTYRWRLGANYLNDNANISGSSTATLSINAAQMTEQGVYTCEIRNAGNQLIHLAAATLIVVNGGPAIDDGSLPRDTTVTAPATADFEADAEGDWLQFQWQYSPDNGANWFDISAVDGNMNFFKFRTEPLATSDDGVLFRCKVYNACGFVFTREATLTVNP